MKEFTFHTTELHFGKKLFELVDLNYLKTLKKVEICIYGIVFQKSTTYIQ